MVKKNLGSNHIFTKKGIFKENLILFLLFSHRVHVYSLLIIDAMPFKFWVYSPEMQEYSFWLARTT